jgi:CRP-like cAMP-binding protein
VEHIDPRRLHVATRLADRPLFDRLAIETLYAVVGAGEIRAICSGQVLCEQGASADACYLVLSGEVELAADGERRITRTAGQGFGELEVLTDELRPETARTIADTECFVLPREAIERLIAGDANVANAAVAYLLETLRTASEQESQRRKAAQEAVR